MTYLTYDLTWGWNFGDGAPWDPPRYEDMGRAIDHATTITGNRREAFNTVARAQMDAMTEGLPDGVFLDHDGHRFGWICRRYLCSATRSGFTYPSGALHAVRDHLVFSHPYTHGLPLYSIWPRYQ